MARKPARALSNIDIQRASDVCTHKQGGEEAAERVLLVWEPQEGKYCWDH